MVVEGGGCYGGGGDGFAMVEVAMVWVGFGSVGVWVKFWWVGSDLVAFRWLSVAEFWWKVLCGFVGERDRKVEEREMEE